MLYETLLKLVDLKPVKWYNFKTKYKNYRLLYQTLSDLKDLLTISANDKELSNKLIDFFLGADALKNLVSPELYGIHIHRGNDSMTNYLCNNKCFHVTITGSALSYLNLFVDTEDKRIEVKFTVHNYHDPDYRDVFYINNGTALGEYNTTAIRKFVVSEIQFVIDLYIKSITKYLYDAYT